MGPVPKAWQFPLLVLVAVAYVLTLGLLIASTRSWDGRALSVAVLLGFCLGFDAYASAVAYRARTHEQAGPEILDPAGGGSPPPLNWSGRPLAEGFATASFVLFVVLIIFAIAETRPAPAPLDTLLVLLWIPGMVLVGLDLAVASRPRSLEVDDTGIRFHRPLVRNVDLRWDEVSSVGLVSATPAFVPNPGPRPGPGPPEFILVFRGRDGRRVGTLSPFAIMRLASASRVVSLIEAHARSRGITVEPVSPLDVIRW